jgi:hypothetical protein
MALIEASRNRQLEDRKFLAAINGVELDQESTESDIVELSGANARHEGFGIDEGLGFIQMGDD